MAGQEQRQTNIMKSFVSQNVVNLSDRVLTYSEMKVLSTGLKFCSTPKKINEFELVKV